MCWGWVRGGESGDEQEECVLGVQVQGGEKGGEGRMR